MKSILKNSIYLLLLILSSSFAIAQENIEIIGKLVEEETSQPIPYATLVIKDKSTNKNITGVITDNSGNFIVTTTKPNFYVEICFMGFEIKTIT